MLNNYLDGVSPGAVTSSHIAVALGHGGADCQVAVLTVHVVGSGPRVVSKPDAEVLDFEWLAFDDGLNADNLSGSLLELTELTEEIPEPRFGDNLVRCEDSHAIEGSLGLILGRQLASDDAILLQSPLALHFYKVITKNSASQDEYLTGKGS